MHISLDSALGQQRRLNQVGESITQIASDPAAAYSLRSLTGGDPKAVRVRRDTDNAEQDFTVSEINSGALVDYVNTSYAKYTSDFSAGDDSWGSLDDVTETGNIDGIGGLDDNLRLAIGSATSNHRAFRTGILPVNQKINFSARVFIPSTNSVVDSLGIRDASGSTIIAAGTTPAQDQWVTVTASNVTTTNSSGQLRVDLQDGGTNNFTGNGSDVIYLREVTVTQVTSDGFVETWYDQSGNGNDATQATAGSQPKIVDTGSLVTGGLLFDGSDDVLTSDFNSTLTNYTFAGVYKVKTIIDNTGFLGKGAGSSDREFFVRMKANGTIEHRIHSTGSASPFFQIVSDTTISANTTFLLAGSFKDSTNSLRLDISDTVKTGTSSIDLHSATSNLLIPSALGNEAHTAIAELLFYNTDQSEKLSDIRTNINNYYSIF